MKRERRKFTAEERLSIIQEAQKEGNTTTCRKYSLSPSLLLRWIKKYLDKGTQGLKDSYHRIDPVVRELEEENEQLKKLVGRMALELEVKTALLKKTPIQPRKR
jgi:transposase-like protein